MGEFGSGLMMGTAMSDSKEEVVAQLRKDGVLLEPQDWGEDFQAKREAITADWFARHPECERGTGQFAKMYPDVVKAQNNLVRMSELGRITEEEFLILAAGLRNF